MLDISSKVEIGRVIVDDAGAFSEFLVSDLGTDWINVSLESRAKLARAVRHVNEARPVADFQWQECEVHGKLEDIRLQAIVLDSGLIRVRWDYALMTFHTQWANPLWAITGLAIEKEKDQVVGKLLSLLSLQREARGQSASLVELDEVEGPILLFSKARRIVRVLAKGAKSFFWPLCE